MPFSRPRAQGALSACQAVLLDLRAGAFLPQRHALQSDQFGLPAQAHAALFSWQVFMGLLDAATALPGVRVRGFHVRRLRGAATGVACGPR